MSYLGKTSLQAANIKRWTGTPGAVNVISFTTLGFNPLNEQSTFITINGVKQHDSSFVLTSAAISFSATLLAADEVEVVAILNVGQPLVPADNSVQRKHLAPSMRNVTQDKFSGNGVLTAFSLSYAPMSSASILVFLNGVSQLAGTDFTVSSTTLTFTTAPITGTDNINVIHLTYATGTAEVIPPDASISDGKIVGMSSSKLTGALPALDGSALTGITHVGGATGLSLNDGVKAQFGTSNDLQIYHDGSNSIIKDAGTGNIHILANDFKVMNAAGDENVIVAYQDGTARLFHNNVTRFETTSTGIDVTGTTVTDSLTIQGTITEQETVKTASFTPNLTTDGTIYDCSGAMTLTMPTAAAGKSFTIIHNGSGTLSFAGTIKWNAATPGSPSGISIYTFISNGTDWYGMQAGTGFA